MLLLVAAFLQPACMTTMLWRDDWPQQVSESTDARALVRRVQPTDRDADSAVAFFVAVDDELRGMLPADARESEWLRLVPREHGYTAAMLLAAASVDWFGLRVDFTVSPEGELTASLACWLASYQRLPHTMLRLLPGFDYHWNLYSSYRFSAACSWQSVPKGQQVPLGLEADLRSIRIRQSAEMTEGRSMTARVLWTPVTVLGDVLLSPFELLVWLRG